MLAIHPSGLSEGRTTHLSVYLNILRGEYDDNLQWPFNGDIVVEMYNYTLKKWGYSRSIKLEGERLASGGRGYNSFMSNETLQKDYCNTYEQLSIVRFRVREVQVENK